jgi:hypothetical protein
LGQVAGPDSQTWHVKLGSLGLEPETPETTKNVNF